MELDTVPSEDDELGAYVPLERPTCSIEPMVQQTAPEKIVYSDEEGEIISSSSDSDNVLKKNKLKRKLPPDPPSLPHLAPNAAKRKKYSVWSDILQEEAIESSFVQSEFFGGDNRGNESYNYRMKDYSKGDEDDSHWRGSSKNCDSKPRKKLKAFTKQRTNKKYPITLPDLKTSVDDTAENVALEIAKNLSEPKTELIERVVHALGKQKAIDIYQQTKQAEQNGGILTLNGARRRTSGGVYLKFVKDQKLPREEFEAIFNYSDDLNKNVYKPKKRKALKPKGVAKETKESSLRDLPLRYELEIPNPSEESDTNILKNPPPSPVYQAPSSSTSPFSLVAQFSPFSENAASPEYVYTPMSPSYSPMSPTYSRNMPRYSPGSSPTERFEISPSYNPLSPDQLLYES